MGAIAGGAIGSATNKEGEESQSYNVRSTASDANLRQEIRRGNYDIEQEKIDFQKQEIEKRKLELEHKRLELEAQKLEKERLELELQRLKATK